jgi:DNA-binding FrmR family transcriptional regulator
MTHTIREKQKLLARARRIRGQVEAIERALESEAGCEQVMHLLAAVRGAMAGLMAEIVEAHVRTLSSMPKAFLARSMLRPQISFSTLSAAI